MATLIHTHCTSLSLTMASGNLGRELTLVGGTENIPTIMELVCICTVC